MKKNKTPKQKEQEDFSTALLDAIVSASKGQSIFDAFLVKKVLLENMLSPFLLKELKS